MQVQLTNNAIVQTYNQDQSDNNFKPILQVIDVKKLNNPSQATGPASDRYRLIISDGKHYQQSMLATQMNHLIEKGELEKHAIIRMNEYMCNIVSSRRIVIILNCAVVGKTDSIIGNPVSVEAVQKGAPSNAPPPPIPTSANNPPRPAEPGQYQPMQVSPQRPPAQFGGQQRAVAFGSNNASSSSLRNGLQFSAPSLTSSSAGSGGTFQPIATLTPYQNRWTIKARVTRKSDMKHFQNAKGEGKLFSVDLLDSEGGEIRATMFGMAADKFYPIFQQDKVYIISRGVLKLANKRFATGIKHEYEMTLNSDAEVQFVGEDNAIQSAKFNFVPLAQIPARPADETVDVLGVVARVSPLSSVMSQKTKRELQKRVLTLTDQDEKTIDLTVWGEDAVNNNEQTLADHPVIAVKSCRISTFGGTSLSTTFGGHLFVRPDRPEAHQLRSWWDSRGHSLELQPLTEKSITSDRQQQRKSFSAIKDEHLGSGEKADWLTVRGTVTYFTHDMDKPPWYLACPTCNKKVTENSNGQYYCATCNKSCDQATPKYVLNLMASDATSGQWLSCFNEAAEAILGTAAANLRQMVVDHDTAAFEQAFAMANFRSFIFDIRCQEQMVNDDRRVKCTIHRVKPVDFRKESKYLLDVITKYG